MINNSVEWNSKRSYLRYTANTKISTPTNREQVCQMIDNIGAEITQLSKAEVLSRRGHTSTAREMLEKINNDIALIEEYILVATLIG